VSDHTDDTASIDFDFSVIQHPRRREPDEITRPTLRRPESGTVAPGAEKAAAKPSLVDRIKQKLARLKKEEPNVYPLW
jgi:hypothetical protein